MLFQAGEAQNLKTPSRHMVNMGDKDKMKTGNLGANVMEDKELLKRLGRVKRQTDYFVAEIEAEQNFIAKRFLSHLRRSTRIAETNEAIMKTFKSTRWNLAFESQKSELTINCRESAKQVVHESPEEIKTRDLNKEHDRQGRSLLLKRMSHQFEVPYKKIYSFDTREFERPATVLNMRCKLWQKIVYCADKKDRAKSACPPWTKNYKPPRHIQLAHYRALQHLGMKSNLVDPPSRQPQIDLEALKNYRNRETEVERHVVAQFTESLEPLKIKPGLKQIVYDANKLYGELAKLNSKLSK